MGSQHFTQTLLENRDLNALVRAMEEPNWRPIPDQWQVEELARATRHHEVVMVCEGIPAETLAQIHVTPAATVEIAIAYALEKTRCRCPHRRYSQRPLCDTRCRLKLSRRLVK